MKEETKQSWKHFFHFKYLLSVRQLSWYLLKFIDNNKITTKFKEPFTNNKNVFFPPWRQMEKLRESTKYFWNFTAKQDVWAL